MRREKTWRCGVEGFIGLAIRVKGAHGETSLQGACLQGKRRWTVYALAFSRQQLHQKG